MARFTMSNARLRLQHIRTFITARRLGVILLFTPLLCLGCRVYYGVWRGDFSGNPQVSDAQKADELRAAGKYPEAIAEYEKHIASRLADSRRDPAENPYFYELYIGDVYVELNDPKEALERYQQALDHDVEIKLVTDRLVRLARYLVKTSKSNEAIDLLRKYRELDIDAFDAEIDETHKKMIHEEDQRDVKTPMRSQSMRAY